MIRIFTHVGLNPLTGGGVASYMRNLAAILNASNMEHEIVVVSQFSKFSMFASFLSYCLDRKPILLNSAFHPFSLLMILFSRSLHLVVMPHGEFLDGALAINKNKKVVVLKIIKWLTCCFGSSRNITIVAASEGEAYNFANWIPVREIQIVQDVLHLGDRLDPVKAKFDHGASPLHVVMIGRMVRMKGFIKVLEDLAGADVLAIQKVSLYYLAEDPVYLAEVEAAAQILRRRGIDVVLIEGRDADAIFLECRNTNSLLIVPSEFESFSYVLVENLWMANKPIVSFENNLTIYLAENGHCRIVNGNRFAEAISSTEPADFFAVSNDMNAFAKAINRNTLEILYGTET